MPDRRRRTSALPFALAAVAALAYASISIYRHNHFASNAFDLGVQDQTVWGYSQLQMIPNTVEMIRNLLGDHFHPILITIAPLYWIWNDARVLLIVQAALLGVAGVPIFWWAREQLGLAVAIAVEVAYFIFWGVLSGVVYDFHHVAFAVPAVSFALYAVLTKNNRLFWPMLAVGLLTRENVALTFAAIGLYVVVVQHRWRVGLSAIAIGIAWFLAVLELVIPAIAGAPYSHWTYQALGTGPASALAHIVRHPISSVRLLFDGTTKLKLWGGVLGSWLFLPLLSPLSLIAVPTMLERLWSSNPMLWSASFHYSMILGPILAFAAIDTARRLATLAPERLRRVVPLTLSLGMAAAGAILTFAFVQPLAELGSYISAAQVSSIQSCLNVIPSGAAVSASNFLLPHLSHRRQIYLLTLKADADYIAIDLATNRGHFYPGEQGQIRDAITKSLASGYGIECSTGSTVVLHRGAGNQTLSPQMTAFLASTTK